MPFGRVARWPVWRHWFGSRSERAAARFLRRLGYRVLARNGTLPAGELDKSTDLDYRALEAASPVIYVEYEAAPFSSKRGANSTCAPTSDSTRSTACGPVAASRAITSAGTAPFVFISARPGPS